MGNYLIRVEVLWVKYKKRRAKELTLRQCEEGMEQSTLVSLGEDIWIQLICLL